TSMLEFLKNSQDEKIAEKYNLRAGVGLAAPQLGIDKRIIAVHFDDPKGRRYSYKLFNPKIVSHSVEKAYLAGGEGCLSVDRDVVGYLVLHLLTTVYAYDADVYSLKLRLRGYVAIVYQHEIDYLYGIIFYDHINEDNPFYIPENAFVMD